MEVRKVVLLYSIFTLACMNVYSKGYIHPRIGAGISNMYASSSSIGQTNSVLSYSAGIIAGFSFSSFRIGTGITYLKQGFEYKNLDVYNTPAGQSQGNIEKADFLFSYHQVIVPLTIGTESNLSGRISLSSEIGFAAGLNVAQSTVMESHTTGKTTYGKRKNGDISVYGMLSIQLVYKINENVGISIGPSGWSEINTFIGLPNWYHKPANVYSITGNAGLLLTL